MLKPRLIEIYTGAALRSLSRRLYAWDRFLCRRPRRVHYFHQCDDPYTQLLLEQLPDLLRRYQIELICHLVGPADDASTPDRERLAAWSRVDAERLAQELELGFRDPGQAPDPKVVAAANSAIAALGTGRAWGEQELAQAASIGAAVWGGDLGNLNLLGQADSLTTERAIAAGRAQRKRRGHYSAATLYYEGEWYWGVDRLAYLQRRLVEERALRVGRKAAITATPPLLMQPPIRRSGVDLQFYCSLRSPYSYLALGRVIALADHYGANLQLRFVLPMVMRGLPVPKAKRLYIVLDAKREAEQLGLPFGRIADPLGEPTERGLAVLNRAISVDKGAQFLTAFSHAVWAEGIDAGSDAGLFKIAKRAGLDRAFVRDALADPSWREVAQANRAEMLSLGLWGVPCFRVGAGAAYWGQDRLWLVERDLMTSSSVPNDLGGETRSSDRP